MLLLLLLHIHASKANSTASLHHRFSSSPRTRLQVPGTRSERVALSRTFRPPRKHSMPTRGGRKTAGRNLEVLVKVITLVSLHLICGLTDFQTVE